MLCHSNGTSNGWPLDASNAMQKICSPEKTEETGADLFPTLEAFFTRHLLLQRSRSPSIALLSSAVMALSHADNPWLGVTDEHGVLQDEPLQWNNIAALVSANKSQSG